MTIGSAFTINSLTNDVGQDSSSVYENTTYGTYQYTISNVGDSILTLQDTCATIEFSLPGAVTGIDSISFASGQGRGKGTVLRIVNTDGVNTITFEDQTALNDGNLYLAGNITLGEFDCFELIYILAHKYGRLVWVETGRSNN